MHRGAEHTSNFKPFYHFHSLHYNFPCIIIIASIIRYSILLQQQIFPPQQLAHAR